MSGTSWAAARELAWQTGSDTPPAQSRVPLDEAIGRIAAAPLIALVGLPTASVSAMDGWAVAGDPPWRVGERVGMGSVPDDIPLAPASARPITTGAPIPAGTFGVLRSEHGRVEPDRDGTLWLERTARIGADHPTADAHVRLRGEELDAGTTLVRAGAVFTPARIALAAACGHDSVLVTERPRVTILITGDELLTSGIPSPGSVRDALGPVLPALARGAGATVVDVLAIGDTAGGTEAAIAAAAGDLVVTTGGSSRGDTDRVRPVLLGSGGIVFDGVDVRPGHPVLLGRSRSGTPVLALPGNPLAALVCFVSFGIPLIRGLLGLENVSIPVIDPPGLPHDVTAAAARGLTVLVPYSTDGGIPVVSAWRGSAMLRGLADADGLLVVEPDGTGGVSGIRVGLLELPW